MKILAAKVDWMFGYENAPTLALLLDKTPEIRSYKEISVPGGLFYLSETEGLVNFFLSNQDKHGFGGRTFEIDLISGEHRSVKGPWSSRAGVANYYLEKPCISCSFTEDQEVWKRGYTFYSGHVLVELVTAFAEQNYPHWELREETTFENETYWVPRLRERYHKNYLISLGIVDESPNVH